MIFFTSDLHLGHENCIRLCNRPFSSIEEMDETLIENWNHKVTGKDTVYILGDLIYRSQKPPEEYLRRLRGKKHLILGNHDRGWIRSCQTEQFFESVNNLLYVADGKRQYIARQFAAGRPDAQDIAQLSDFAKQIQHKLSEADTSEPVIPGNRPYKKAGGVSMVPKATKECTNCGACAAACPVQAIDKENPKKVDEKACISCMRCIAVCPHGARKVNPVMLSAASLMLKKVCSERKECELFL